MENKFTIYKLYSFTLTIYLLKIAIKKQKGAF